MKTIRQVKDIPPYANLRKEKGWKQADVAAELGVCRETISNYETMKTVPDKDAVVKMDSLYGCKGELIRYWLETKFSYKVMTIPQSFIMVFRKVFSFMKKS